MIRPFRHLLPGLLGALVAAGFPTAPAPAADLDAVVTRYCLECHDRAVQKGDVDLESALDAPIPNHAPLWERALRQLRAQHMPPPDEERPDPTTSDVLVSFLENKLDAAALANPDPGRTPAVRRLTRTEYRNVIRDLLALDIDPADLLPRDEESHGFDNVTVTALSPTLLEQYITAAQKVSRLALGTPPDQVTAKTVRLRPDLTQESRAEGLPHGTRGGLLIDHIFPRDGEYEVVVRLARDRNEHVEGLHDTHELTFLLDLRPVGTRTVKPPPNPDDHSGIDRHLVLRLPVTAGPHALGITFANRSGSLLETLRQPYNAHFNTHRHPRLSPAIYEVSITGPHGDHHTSGNSPSRRRILFDYPATKEDEDPCARTILSNLMRRAYRRPITDADLARPLELFRTTRDEAGFDPGIEAALSAILVHRDFLFKIELDPPGTPPDTPYPLGSFELASRLAFFLWSSLPDDTLLDAAARGDLAQPDVLAAQARRMLADPKADSLVTNFADQWLYLRNLAAFTPDGRLYPDFDHNLRQAFRRETELLFRETLRDDRSVLGLLRADHTFLNERLAKHYGVPHIYGTRFRRVALPADTKRGGLLRHGSILTVTSYPTRTSPVLRGNWILENLMGTPAPPPPPDVPALEDNTVDPNLPVRQRLAAHRAQKACASCHAIIDPVGFTLENYDATGRWRDLEHGHPVDSSGGLLGIPAPLEGVSDLEDALLERPETFVRTLTEKLLTYALGRGVTPADAPAVRAIVRASGSEDFRFSAIVVNLVQSPPFTHRRTQP